MEEDKIEESAIEVEESGVESEEVTIEDSNEVE